MHVISSLNSLTFWSLFHVISISFSPKTHFGPTFFKEITVCVFITLVRQICFPTHFVSVAHCCPVVLIEDVTQM